jgi:glycosyltransferase involved in cell wall biosynthesis
VGVFRNFNITAFKNKRAIKKTEKIRIIMKIGIDIRNIGKKRTGDEAVFFNLVKNLANIDSKNDYFLFTDITGKVILQKIIAELGIANKPNFKIISLKCPNKFIWNAWILPGYLKNSPVDVYHTQYITPFFVPKKVKIITTIHDISFNFFPRFIKWRDLFFLKTLIPTSLKKADKIIAVSQFTKGEIIKYYKINPNKVEVVCNAVGDNFTVAKFPPGRIYFIPWNDAAAEKPALFNWSFC